MTPIKDIRTSLLLAGILCASALSAQLTTESLVVDGQTRTYLQYVPVDFDAEEQVPLVLCFHGGSGVAEGQLAIGDLRDTADEERFILAYPQALPDPNDGGSTNWQVVTSGDLPFTVPNPHSDIDFVAALIDEMHTLHGVDLTRVYAMGYSNGGGFVYDLACRLNDQITGVGAVARTMYAESYANCQTTHPTPIVTILGTNDFASNYDGVVYEGTLYYHSSDEGNALWIDENELLPYAELVELPDLNTSDGSTVERYQWSDADGCRELTHYKVLGGDHDWPGAFGNMDIVSHEVIWDHLKEFDMDGRIACGPLAVENEERSTWSIAPNPASSHLIIHGEHLNSPVPFHIFNASGVRCLDGNVASTRTAIELHRFDPGLYGIHVNGETRMFIVQ
ncbi:MAG: hypothetical protein CL828_09980 [Crocinitomicaceae bacterium]|nr:hypothetical protein [Crocinitomicaceae bacterium]